MLSEELIRLADKICRIQSETQTVEVKAAHHGCPTRLYDTLSSSSASMRTVALRRSASTISMICKRK